MKLRSLLLTSAAALVLAASAHAQSVLAKWTFDAVTLSGTGATSPTATAGSLVADTGILTGGSLASGFHAGSVTVWSTPVGNNSTKSLSSNTWAIGDYYQFLGKTTGYQGISVSWDQTGSSTGPTSFTLAYSVDGTNFTNVGSYAIVASTGTNIIYSDTTTGGAWSSSKNAVNTFYTYDLSAVADLDNATTVYFRLVNNLAPGGSGGTNRVDNFSIMASNTFTAVPEPSTYAMLAGAAVLAGVLVQRRMRRASVAA